MEIAIIRRNGLGDLLLALPLVRSASRKWPGSRITLMIDERAEELAPYLRGVCEVVVLPSSPNKYVGVVKGLWRLRKRRFDVAISAKVTPMKLMNFFLRGLRAERRIAYVDEAWHSRLINEPRVGLGGHQALECLRLLEPQALRVEPADYPRLEVEPLPRVSEKPMLFISVSNNRVGSRLDLEKYAKLPLRRFYVVISCEPKDKEMAEKLSSLLEGESGVYPTRSLKECLELMASCDAVFSGDGGIMHLAAALDKPQVVLFGGTKVEEWAPLTDKAVLLFDPANVNFIDEKKIAQALEGIL